MAPVLAVRQRVAINLPVPIVLIVIVATSALPQASGLKQAIIQPNGILLSRGGNASEQAAKSLAKPHLRLSFSARLNSSTEGLKDVSADANRLAISVRDVGVKPAAHSNATVNTVGDASSPHDGVIVDFTRGQRFSHQRFFEETVCYKLDLGLGYESASGGLGSELQNISGMNASNASNHTVDFHQLERQAAFHSALGEFLGAPLELYPGASAASSGSLREVAGQRCATWVANRTLRQPLSVFAALPAFSEMGWRAPPSAVLLHARDTAERKLSEAAEAGAEAVLSENASFCVSVEGEVLATSSGRSLSFAVGNGSLTVWDISQHTTATSAPSRSPDPKAFDSEFGIAGGRCIDLTQGSTGPTELNMALNAEERLARINAEAAGHWQATPYKIWEGVKVEQVQRSLGTEMRPLRLPLRTALMGEVLSGFGGAVGAAQPPPSSFDARRNWPHCISMGIVRNQGSCGSCWAFAAAAVLQDRFCVAATADASANALAPAGAGVRGNASALLQDSTLERLRGLDLAPEHLVDCDGKNSGCSGGRLDDAWQYLCEHGMPPESCSPYRFCQVPTAPKCGYHQPEAVDASLLVGREHGEKGQCTSTCAGGEPMRLFRASAAYAVAPPGDVAGLQLELMAHGPVQVAFFVFSDFHNYRSGVYFRTPGAYGPLGGHAVRLLGWGSAAARGGAETDYWLAANSWSPSWGLGGFFRIRRGANECGIETTPAAGLPDLGPGMGEPWRQ